MSMTTSSKSRHLVWVSPIAALAAALATPAEAKIEFVWVKTYEVVLVQDIVPGNAGSIPQDLTVFNGALYFSADDGVHGRELWRYDGSSASLVAEIAPGPASGLSSTPMTAFDGALYFGADDGIHGRELWRYDGSSASLVAEIFPGPGSGVGTMPMAVLAGALYFTAWDSSHGVELWRYDGNSASLVVDLSPGPPGSMPAFLTVFDGALYFVANDGQNGHDLWRYDGSTATLAADVSDEDSATFNGHLAELDGELYLFNVGPKCSADLCKLNVHPTPIHIDISPAEYPWYPGVFKGELYFAARDDLHGTELWKYNGSTASLVADMVPGAWGSGPSDLTVYDGELFFEASDDLHGRELFRGTSLVKDIFTGTSGAHPEWLTVYDGALYFAANHIDHGRELWRCRFTGLRPRMYADLRLPYKKPWEWPVDHVNDQDPFAGTLATLALAEGESPRLLARHSVDLSSPRAVAQPLYESPVLDQERLPPAMALVSALLHDASGQLLGSEMEIVAISGDLDPQARQRLERNARSFLETATVEQVRGMEIQELAVVHDGVEPQQPAAPWQMIIIAALILVVATLVWMLRKRATSS